MLAILWEGGRKGGREKEGREGEGRKKGGRREEEGREKGGREREGERERGRERGRERDKREEVKDIWEEGKLVGIARPFIPKIAPTITKKLMGIFWGKGVHAVVYLCTQRRITGVNSLTMESRSPFSKASSWRGGKNTTLKIRSLFTKTPQLSKLSQQTCHTKTVHQSLMLSLFVQEKN